VARAAVESELTVLEAMQYTREPAVVPLGGGGEGCVALDVRRLPGEPEGGEFLHYLGVIGPAFGGCAGPEGSDAGSDRPSRRAPAGEPRQEWRLRSASTNSSRCLMWVVSPRLNVLDADMRSANVSGVLSLAPQTLGAAG